MEAWKLLIRSDDLGYSEAVNYGILKVMQSGISLSCGLMPNMESAKHGADLVKYLNVCVGQHTNICVGRPVSDPKEIPSLVDENGEFYSSRKFHTAKEDFVVYEEAIREVEAQLFRFRELMGRDPEYFEGHAVRSDNYRQAIRDVAAKYGLKHSEMYTRGYDTALVNQQITRRYGINNLAEDYDAVACLKETVRTTERDYPGIYVCHPGYVDAYLMKHSSLTLNRTKDAEMLCDPNVLQWLKEQKVELISYREIGNE